MMRYLFLPLILIVLGSLIITSSPPAYAYDAFPKIDCTDASKAKESTVCHTGTEDPISGTNGILLKATDIVAYLAGAFAIIMILIASFRLVSSGSDISTNSRTDTDVETARKIIANSLIGLAVIVLARTIITYVIIKWTNS